MPRGAGGMPVSWNRPLALDHVDLDTGLPIGCCREYLALPCGDGGVAFDEFGCDTAQGLYAQRERGDIEQDNIFCLTGQHSTLDSCTESNAFIGVDTFVGIFSQNLFYGILEPPTRRT
jgi:hypothetical protein